MTNHLAVTVVKTWLNQQKFSTILTHDAEITTIRLYKEKCIPSWHAFHTLIKNELPQIIANEESRKHFGIKTVRELGILNDVTSNMVYGKVAGKVMLQNVFVLNYEVIENLWNYTVFEPNPFLLYRQELVDS